MRGTVRTINVGALGAAILVALACALLLVPDAADSRAKKFKVTLSSPSVVAGSSVVIKFKGTNRTKCSLSVRADRKGSKPSMRKRIKRTYTLRIPATSAAGVRIISVRCGSRKASKRLTVTRPAAAPTPGPGVPPDVEGELGALPIDADEVNSYKVRNAVGGGSFSTRIPFAKGTSARISQGAGGTWSHTHRTTRNAADLVVPLSTPVLAGFSGIVAAAVGQCNGLNSPGCNSGWGNFVLLKHADGSCAIFAHLRGISVAAGQSLDRYGEIGTVGSSGNSTGVHLHFDHVDCATGASLPWQFEETGYPTDGQLVVSANDAPQAGPVATPVPTPAPTAVPTAAPTAVPTPVPTAPPPPPTVSVSKGGSAQGRSGCSSSACRFLNVNWANFHGGGHTVKCHASHGDEGGFWTYAVSGGAGGSAVCYYGYGGRVVWATVDGVASNQIGW